MCDVFLNLLDYVYEEMSGLLGGDRGISCCVGKGRTYLVWSPLDSDATDAIEPCADGSLHLRGTYRRSEQRLFGFLMPRIVMDEKASRLSSFFHSLEEWSEVSKTMRAEPSQPLAQCMIRQAVGIVQKAPACRQEGAFEGVCQRSDPERVGSASKPPEGPAAMLWGLEGKPEPISVLSTMTCTKIVPILLVEGEAWTG